MARLNDLTQEENALLEFIVFALRRIASSANVRSSLTEAPFVAKLEEFGLIFREDQGLKAMKNYIDWAEACRRSPNEILSTIGHDVYGRHERFMSPRSSSYLEVTPEEIEELRKAYTPEEEALVAVNCKDCGGLFGHRGNCKQLQNK